MERTLDVIKTYEIINIGVRKMTDREKSIVIVSVFTAKGDMIELVKVLRENIGDERAENMRKLLILMKTVQNLNGIIKKIMLY